MSTPGGAHTTSSPREAGVALTDSKAPTNEDESINAWLLGKAKIHAKIVDKTLEKLEAEEVFTVADLAVMARLPVFDTLGFTAVTAQKIKDALGVAGFAAPTLTPPRPLPAPSNQTTTVTTKAHGASRAVSASLEGAKNAATQDRWRITLPCLILSVMGQLGFVSFLTITYTLGCYTYLISTPGMMAVVCAMLALLPSDYFWTSVFMRLLGGYYMFAGGLCYLIANGVDWHLVMPRMQNGGEGMSGGWNVLVQAVTGDYGNLSVAEFASLPTFERDYMGYCLIGPMPWQTCAGIKWYYFCIGLTYFLGGVFFIYYWFVHRNSPRKMIVRMWKIAAYVEISFSVVMFMFIPLTVLIKRSDWAIFEAMCDRKGLSLGWLIADWCMHLSAHLASGILAERDTRLWFQSMLAQRSEGVAAAAGVSSLLGGRDGNEILQVAKAVFRAINLGKLRRRDVESNVPDPDLYKMSEPAGLGTVDVFISHSWHDDGGLKWKALKAFREQFEKDHDRSPMVWFDKACINQRNLDMDLPCMPVFLAGCTNLLLLVGTTYPNRLWCVIELFVFLYMGDRTVFDIQRIVLGDRDEEVQLIIHKTLKLDVRMAMCFNPEDQDRLLSLIEGGFGSYDDFNLTLRTIFKDLTSDNSNQFLCLKRGAQDDDDATLVPVTASIQPELLRRETVEAALTHPSDRAMMV